MSLCQGFHKKRRSWEPLQPCPAGSCQGGLRSGGHQGDRSPQSPVVCRAHRSLMCTSVVFMTTPVGGPVLIRHARAPPKHRQVPRQGLWGAHVQLCLAWLPRLRVARPGHPPTPTHRMTGMHACFLFSECSPGASPVPALVCRLRT